MSFTIDRGEWVFITGPSGAGKSTLLNLIFGILEPTAGDITVAGVHIAHAADRELRRYRRHLGFVFQNARLLDHLSVFENIAFPLHIRGFSDAIVEKLVYNALEPLNMTNLAEAPASTLSGGEKQKVAFARAYVTKPPIVLADEPTGNLDAESGQVIMELFRKIHMQGTTVMLATHDESWIRRYPQRRIILNRGYLTKDL